MNEQKKQEAMQSAKEKREQERSEQEKKKRAEHEAFVKAERKRMACAQAAIFAQNAESALQNYKDDDDTKSAFSLIINARQALEKIVNA